MKSLFVVVFLGLLSGCVHEKQPTEAALQPLLDCHNADATSKETKCAALNTAEQKIMACAKSMTLPACANLSASEKRVLGQFQAVKPDRTVFHFKHKSL